MLAVDELIHSRCKLNQLNRSLGMVGWVLDVVFLCDDLYMSNAGVIFTFHERREQEYYYLHRGRELGLVGHPPAHPGKNMFSVD